MSFKKDRSGPVRRDFLRAVPALLMARQPAGARGPEIAPSGQSLAGPREPSDVVIENEDFRLVLAADATARSLIEKRTGQECLAPAKMPVFAITQYSPLAGQLILLYPAGANTFPACTVRREGDLLVVGFEGVPHEVVLKLNVAPHYAAFTVAETRTDAKGWKGWAEQDQWKTPSDIPGVRCGSIRGHLDQCPTRIASARGM